MELVRQGADSRQIWYDDRDDYGVIVAIVVDIHPDMNDVHRLLNSSTISLSRRLL
jgi:hypothetical protein